MAKTSQSDTSSHDGGTKKTASATKVKKRTRKSVPRDTPLQRSSVHRGVTRHRWTGRYEAHLWDKNCWNESQNKKGRQVYLGAYDDEEAAAHAYDLAALKYWGPDTILNFPLSTYEQQVKEMEGQSREEYIGSLRRKSSGFSRGVSKYRGVARHHHNGRWEARIGRVFGNKYLYLGTYGTQEEAAMAYDMAAIEYRGVNAVTNFDLSRYIKWLRPAAPKSNQQEDTAVVVDDSAAAENVPKWTDEAAVATTRGSSASSALGLLLQSSKFKEMLERTSSTSTDDNDNDNDNSPPPPSTAESDHNFLRPRKSFPDDIQTYFHCSQDAATTFDDTIFADLNSFASPIFNSQLVDN